MIGVVYYWAEHPGAETKGFGPGPFGTILTVSKIGNRSIETDPGKGMSMKLIVLIPVYNEESTICDVIRRIPKSIAGIRTIEVVVVDDGSQDRSAELAKREGANVLGHGSNRGVGAAFQTGVEYAVESGTDILVNMDGDGQFSPEDIPRLIAPILAGKAQMVTASRFSDDDLKPKMSPVKYWGNVCMSRLVSVLTGRKIYDVSCGFRAYTRDVLYKMNLYGRFTYTHETCLDLSFKNVEITEVPLSVCGTRESGKSRVASNLFRYAVKAGLIILRSFRDYKPMLVFGGFALVFFVIGIGFLIFLYIHYVTAGKFTPHKWAGFAGAGFLGISLLTLVTGLLADMMGRIRRNQDHLMYLMRKQLFETETKTRNQTEDREVRDS